MRRPLGPRLSLAAVAVVATLGALEAAVRLAAVDLNPNPRLRYHRQLGWTLEPGWKGLDAVDRRGFRHTARLDGGEERRRIVVLGDSFSVGGQYPYAQTYPGRLQERLGAEAWEVVNLSASGWGTAQQLIALRLHGLDPPPAAIVLQVFPNNDLCNNNLEQRFSCSFLDLHRPYFVLDGERLERRHVYPLRARARGVSRLFGLAEVRLGWGLPIDLDEPGLTRKQRRALRKRAMRAGGRRAGLDFASNLYPLVPEPHQPPAIRRGWRVTERLLAEISRLAGERGIPLVAVVVPFAETFDPRWLAQQLAGERHLRPDYATSRVEAFLERRGAAVVSVRRRILDGAEPWQRFFYPRGRRDRHFHERGHRRVADWVLAELRALGVVADGAAQS